MGGNHNFHPFKPALRIMGSQNWWFGDPRPLRKTHPNPSFSQGPEIRRVVGGGYGRPKSCLAILWSKKHTETP